MDFTEYVAARGRALWRAAWLLTGDAQLALPVRRHRPTGQPAPGSVVVAVRDRTDDVRTFTITGPDHLVTWFQTADGAPQPVGYAGSALMGLTHLSR